MPSPMKENDENRPPIDFEKPKDKRRLSGILKESIGIPFKSLEEQNKEDAIEVRNPVEMITML